MNRFYLANAGVLAVMMALTFLSNPVAADEPGERLMPEPLRDRGGTHELRLIYFVPADREPVDQWRARIQTLMTFVNDAIRRDLVEKGYETEGFDFEFADNGELDVHLVRGEEPARHYSGAPDYDYRQQWQTVNPEVEAELGPPRNRLHMIFVETYDEDPAPHEWLGANAQAAFLSADAGAAMKSAWILRPELCATTVDEQLDLLFDDTPISGRTALGHGQPDSPRLEFIEDGYGAVIHELGHALSLYHDNRDGLYHMGNGFRSLRTRYRAGLEHEQRSRFSEDAARFLARSRFLAPSTDDDREAPVMTVRVRRNPQAGDEQIELGIEATDDTALAAAIFYTAANDSVARGVPMEGERVEIESLAIPHPAMRAGQHVQIQGRIVDEAGNFAHLSLELEVGGGGD